GRRSIRHQFAISALLHLPNGAEEGLRSRDSGLHLRGSWRLCRIPDVPEQQRSLGGHLKSGQSGSLQNRPVERIQDSYIFTSSVIGLASFFPSESSSAQQLGL